MTSKEINTLSSKLALLGGAGAGLACLVLDQMLVMVDVSILALIAGLVMGIVTFITAKLCLTSIVKKPDLSGAAAARRGVLAGLMALLFLTLIVSIVMEGNLREYFGWFFVIFIFGGFLAPVIGGITAWRITKNRY